MVKIGAPTMVEMESIRQGAESCREMGLSFLELNINFPQFTLEKLDVAELKAIAEEFGIFYTLHLDDEMSIADFNPYVADGYCRTVYDAVELAKKLGIRKLNMHMSRGAKYTLPDRVIYFFEAYEEEYINRIRRFRDTCTEIIGDSGVMICVENTAGFLPFQRRAVEEMLESPAFGLTFDIGHNYCSGNMDEAWIRQNRNRLHHMHIHDACDGKKDHRTLGTGELDIPGYMALAEETGSTVVLETKTLDALRESLAWLREEKSDGSYQ